MHTSSKPGSEAGFTIVEVLIASVIMVVLAFFISTLLFNSQRAQSRLEDRAARSELIQGAAIDLRLRPVP